jgi:muramoyltetrapeptide carboxypeptidase
MFGSRRKFLSVAGLSALGVGLLKAQTKGKDFVMPTKLPELNYPINDFSSRILPAGLKAGSTVAITAPASPTSMYEIRNGKSYFQSLGCKVIVGETISNQKNENRYLSAPDKVRADEFMSFIRNKQVDAIICGRGGYGSMRILPYLDFNEIAANPKIIIGFSDITALLNAIYRKTGLVTFHGPVATTNFEDFKSNNLKHVLFNNANSGLYQINSNQAITINEGIGSGQLVGGNLTILSSMLGTEYEIETSGKILFIEEVSEHAYQIDRMITQLLLANKIQSASAVIFGNFQNLNIRRPFFPNRGYTILEVIQQLVKPTMIPCMVGFPFGHISSKFTLPIGIAAELDTQKKSLKFTEKTVI